MSYILRQYRCLDCGAEWESLTQPAACIGRPLPGWEWKKCESPNVVRIVGVPASYKHSSWESWRK